MRRFIPFGLALALALPLLTPSRPAAAAEEPQVIAQAAGDDDPFVFAWVDDKDGKLGGNDDLEVQIHDVFAKIQWVFLDNGRIALGHLTGNNLEVVYNPHRAGNQEGTYYLFHERSQDRKQFLNGSIVRSSEDPSRGYAEFTMLFLQDDGSSATVHVEQNLTFQTTTGGGTGRG